MLWGIGQSDGEEEEDGQIKLTTQSHDGHLGPLWLGPHLIAFAQLHMHWVCVCEKRKLKYNKFNKFLKIRLAFSIFFLENF